MANYAIFSEVISRCFTRFEKRKISFMLFNRQLECKGTLKHLCKNQIDDLYFIIHLGIYSNLKWPIELDIAITQPDQSMKSIA